MLSHTHTHAHMHTCTHTHTHTHAVFLVLSYTLSLLTHKSSAQENADAKAGHKTVSAAPGAKGRGLREPEPAPQVPPVNPIPYNRNPKPEPALQVAPARARVFV